MGEEGRRGVEGRGGRESRGGWDEEGRESSVSKSSKKRCMGRAHAISAYILRWPLGLCKQG